MKRGDLICVKDKLTSVRIYTNRQCNTSETCDKNICLLISESQNQFGQDILMVLFSHGIRWVYKMDFHIIQ